jgi:cell division protein ZapB
MRRAYNLLFSFPITKQLRAMAKIEELADRVERLLLRFDELSRTQQLVEAQLASVTQERDSLKSRLNAARSRIDALLDRLPTDAFASDAVAPEAEPLAVSLPSSPT